MRRCVHIQPGKNKTAHPHPNLLFFAVAGCGSVAGVASALVSGPVEHVRIRLQLQGPRAPPTIATVAVDAPLAGTASTGARAFSTAAAAAPVEYGGSVDAFKSIYKQHGLRGIFRGLPATGVREAVGCGMYFGVYEVAKRQFAESVGGVENLGIHHFLMAGGLSGVLAWIPSYPIDIIKSKIQADVLTGNRRYPNVSALCPPPGVRSPRPDTRHAHSCTDASCRTKHHSLTRPEGILSRLFALSCPCSTCECHDFPCIRYVAQGLDAALRRVQVHISNTSLICRDGHEISEQTGLKKLCKLLTIQQFPFLLLALWLMRGLQSFVLGSPNPCAIRITTTKTYL